MNEHTARQNRSLVRRLGLMVAGSFAFGFALVPLYDVFCDVAGIRVNTSPVEAREVSTVSDRRVTVEFVSAVALGDEWELVPLAAATPGLFGDARSDTEAWERLLERLQARLGDAQVHGLATHPDHRPERGWRAVSEREAADPASARPLWLLEPPRRLAEGECTLLAGPERIESMHSSWSDYNHQSLARPVHPGATIAGLKCF